MIIEDKPSIASMTSGLLESRRCSVLYLFDAWQAQRHMDRVIDAGERVPNLTLLGNLDNEDHVVDYPEALDANSEVPPIVVLRTRLPREELHDMPGRTGAVGFILSPSTREDLLRFVRAVLRARPTEITKQKGDAKM